MCIFYLSEVIIYSFVKVLCVPSILWFLGSSFLVLILLSHVGGFLQKHSSFLFLVKVEWFYVLVGLHWGSEGGDWGRPLAARVLGADVYGLSPNLLL